MQIRCIKRAYLDTVVSRVLTGLECWTTGHGRIEQGQETNVAAGHDPLKRGPYSRMNTDRFVKDNEDMTAVKPLELHPLVLASNTGA